MYGTRGQMKLFRFVLSLPYGLTDSSSLYAKLAIMFIEENLVTIKVSTTPCNMWEKKKNSLLYKYLV